MRRLAPVAIVGALYLCIGAAPGTVLEAVQTSVTPPRAPDVHFVPTPPEVVDAMLKVANVGRDDLVYDLGCGDGRIVVAAAKNYGARAVGVDIDPQRIKEAQANARAAGVDGRVRFVQGDLFEIDLRPATVVTLYLLEQLNAKLQPKLVTELRPGARVVSHAFGMGAWKPDRELTVSGSHVYLWTIPKAG
jgi:SAM-dependent methyltransferase